MRIDVTKLSVAIAGAAFFSFVTGRTAQCATLGAEDFSIVGGASDSFKEFNPTLAIGQASMGAGPSSSAPATNAPLFEGTTITPADVGRTFSATPTTDHNFNDFVAFLTDGSPDKVTITFGSGSLGRAGLFATKSGALFGGHPDLNGNTINSISLRINSFTLDRPGINPNGDGIWTDYSFNGTVTVDGQPVAAPPLTPVPEPISAFGPLAFGALVAVSRRHQLKKRTACL